MSGLISKFGSEAAVNTALSDLRTKVRQAGLGKVSIGICANPDRQSVTSARNCGFDVLTNYNDHTAGFKSDQKEVPIDSLLTGERRVWEGYKKFNNFTIVPVVTLNWDPRPWAKGNPGYTKSPIYVGFSSASVYKSISSIYSWMKRNTGITSKENIAVIYAWNEYGEGGWLTPSSSGNQSLESVKSALSSK